MITNPKRSAQGIIRTTHARGSFRALARLLLICLAAAAIPLYAVISIENLDDITISGWDGITSNVIGFDDYCVISYSGALTNPTIRSYDVAMRGASDGNGNFILEHSTTNATLPVSFTWSHNNGSSFSMKDYSKTFSTTELVPGATNCNEPDANVRIKVVISESALQNAAAGTYNSTYEIDAFQSAGGGQYTGFQSFQVTLPELVQVTGLDDIVMNGEANQTIVAKDNFCIFRNHSGDIRITSTSQNGAASNKFRLTNVNGDFINYRVAYKQQAGFRNVRQGRAKSGFTGSPIKDCGAGTNTEIRIRIPAAQTAGKSGGSYTDTLTILVEPE